MSTPAAEPSAPRRRWRLRIALLLGLGLVVALRVALPALIRSQLEQQGTALLAGRLTVGDVDLEVLRGAVALEDVALRADDAGPDELPLVASDRLWVNIGWLALARKTVDVEEAGIRGLRVRAERLADGTLDLPGLRAALEDAAAEEEAAPEEAAPEEAAPEEAAPEEAALEEAAPEEAAPEEAAPGDAADPAGAGIATEPTADDASAPWDVVVRRLTFRRGEIDFADRVAEPAELREVSLPSLTLTGLRLRPDPDAGPGRARVRLGLGDGQLEVRTRVRPVEDGFDVALAVEATDLPLDRVHVHLPVLGWSGSTGRLSGLVTARLEPKAPLVARGEIELDDVGIEVPGEDGEALAWKRLAVEVEQIDLAAQRADVTRVALAGARVLVRPEAPAPLPVLAGVLDAASKAADAPTTDPGDAAPWRWAVKTVQVSDARVTVFLEPAPLEVDVRQLEVAGLSSKPGSESRVAATIGIADGTLAIDGPVTLDPVGGTLAVHAEDLDLGSLAAAVDAAPVPFAARADADLEVIARDDPLVVSGRVDLRDVETKVDDGEEFLVAWKRLALGVGRVEAPGLLPFGDAPGLGDVAVTLGSAELEAPRIVATLTPDGLVLPDVPGGAAAGEAAEAVPPAEADGPVGRAFSLLVERLTVRDGDVRFTDETVTPAYRGRLGRLTVDARGLRLPENRIDVVTVSTRVGDKAPVEVKSRRRGDVVTVTSTVRDVPLSQFNPYATAYGYRIGKGTLSLDSETTLRAKSYDSENRVDLHRLVVTGVEGDALFKKTFGVPLTVALALLRDLEGRIVLGVPVSGGERGSGVAVGAIVREALARALVGALASPLKLLGAVKLGKGRIEAFEPAPVAFVPGTTTVARESTAQVKQLAGALAQLPAVRIQLGGRAGAKDVRALAERAVLAKLEDESGVVGGVRNLFSGGTRAAVRDALRERAAGKEAPLEGDAATQLDAWVAEQTVDTAELLRLANERAALLGNELRDGGARPEQLVVGEARMRRKGGRPEVDVTVAEEPVDDSAG